MYINICCNIHTYIHYIFISIRLMIILQLSFSARNGLGAAWWPGIATSRALLRVEQSTPQMAASHACTWIATASCTSALDKSQVMSRVEQPVHRLYSPPAPCQGVGHWGVFAGEHVQGERRLVSSLEIGAATPIRRVCKPLWLLHLRWGLPFWWPRREWLDCR